MATKQVSQSTFDAIVREAMSDFGMSACEALAEARSQLELAGVSDLSNIITSLPPSESCEHPVVALLDRLRLALRESGENRSNKLAGALDALACHARKDSETCGVAGARGVMTDIAKALTLEPVHASAALFALCESSEVNRSSFLAIPGSLQILADVFTNVCDSKDSVHGVSTVMDETADEDRLKVLHAVRVILDKCEIAKSEFALNEKCVKTLFELLSAHSSHSIRVLCLCVCILRVILSADDTTTAVCDTFNRARMFSRVKSTAGNTQIAKVPPSEEADPLPNLIFNILAAHLPEGIDSVLQQAFAPTAIDQSTVALVVDCLALARICAVSDEICKAFVDLGFHNIALNLISPNSGLCTAKASLESASLVSILVARTGMSFLRNIAAHDNVKAKLSEHVSVVCAVVQDHRTDAVLAERFCSFIGVLCLRRPDIASALTSEHNLLETILTAMELHSETENLQRSGCAAIRVLIARSDDQKRLLREDGRAEKIVRLAQDNFPILCRDVAYYVLYDLDVLREHEIRRDRRYTTPF